MDFEKRMTGFYMHSVCLPEKVTEYFIGFVGKPLELKCQGSESWYVGLVGSGDKLILQPGWSDFASANNVLQNDLLRFKFLRGCTFEVRILNPSGYEKRSRFIRKGGEVKVHEGNIPRSSSRIKTVTRGNCTGANNKTDKPNPDTRKRSSSQNQSFLPLKKRSKVSGRQSLSKEEDKSMCKEVHTIFPQKKEGLLESKGENDISVVEKFNEWEKKEVEDGRRNYLLVCEHQALLRRKMQLMEGGRATSAFVN